MALARFPSKQDSQESSLCPQIAGQEQSRSEQEASKLALKRLTEEVHTQHSYKLRYL